MCAQRLASLLVLLAGTLGATGCDAVDAARDRFARTDTVSTTIGSGLALGLQAPPLLRPGEEGVLRVSLTNRTDTVVSHVRLELVAPGWLELMPPRVGDAPVTLTANADGTTLFSYGMDDTPLEPGALKTVEQRIQVPVSGLVTDST